MDFQKYLVTVKVGRETKLIRVEADDAEYAKYKGGDILRGNGIGAALESSPEGKAMMRAAKARYASRAKHAAYTSCGMKRTAYGYE